MRGVREKWTICLKHDKITFRTHVGKNIINYQLLEYFLQKYLRKGFKTQFCYIVAQICSLGLLALDLKKMCIKTTVPKQ